METYGEWAKEILNELHTARLDYESEYLPLIDCALQCISYEETGLGPEEVEELKVENRGLKANKAIMEQILEGKHNPHDTALITQQMLQIAQLRTELEKLNTPRLRELAQAERDGRLVVLPCKVGDTVYLDDGRDRDTAEVDHFQVYKDKVILSWVQYDRSPECTELWDFDEVDCNEIGKTVFLSPERADKDG